MTFPGSSHQRWLEAPYDDAGDAAAEIEDAIDEATCNECGEDLDGPARDALIDDAQTLEDVESARCSKCKEEQ